jgi:hypothetical protein
MIKKLLFALLLAASFPLFAQNDNTPMGARAVGMGNTAVTNRDAWALFNNLAGLSEMEDLEVHFGYQLRYGITEFNTYALTAVSPLSFGGVAGVSVYRFGDEFYSEQRIGLGYSHKISFTSVGVKLNYVQVAVDDQIGITQGARRAFTFEIGGLATLTDKLSFGMHAYNFNQGRLRSEYIEDRLPVILKAGLAYRPIKTLIINVETEKDIDYPASLKAGLEYEIVKKVFLRTGISTRPFDNHFGIGFFPKKFSFEYALSTNTRLGFSHHLTLGYRFEKARPTRKSSTLIDEE